MVAVAESSPLNDKDLPDWILILYGVSFLTTVVTLLWTTYRAADNYMRIHEKLSEPSQSLTPELERARTVARESRSLMKTSLMMFALSMPMLIIFRFWGDLDCAVAILAIAFPVVLLVGAVTHKSATNLNSPPRPQATNQA